MEFWENEKKIAFTTKPTPAELTTNAGYVWEKNGLTGPPYKYTASFVTDTDARVYLTAKYPHALEKITSAVEEAARPNPPDQHIGTTASAGDRATTHTTRAALK
jgi:hypothetical protein